MKISKFNFRRYSKIEETLNELIALNKIDMLTIRGGGDMIILPPVKP